MRSKLQLASAVALAATVLTAMLSAEGSGAAASEMVPTPAKQEPAVEFVSRPVVQSLSDDAQSAADTADDDNGEDTDEDTSSLAQLVSQQAMPSTLSKDMRCLAGAVYFEARGESLEGQLAVARVVINRAESGRFPDSYCGVVYQPLQFSFVHGHSMPSIGRNAPGWRQAVAIARIAEDGSWKSMAKGALFFHAARVSPNWHLTRLARVDNHIFYR